MKKLRNIVLTLLTLSIPVCAFDFIVPTGTTETMTVTLADDGNSALIEEGGAIVVANDDGVSMENDNQTVLNEGRISVSGAAGSNGVYNGGHANATIINSGLIFTTGGTNRGILNDSGADSNNAVITNSGLISTTGNSSVGILNDGNNAVITNSGRISTGGTTARGIENNGINAVITNSGLISTAGNSAQGIFNDTAPDAAITNSGRISTLGTSASGIENEEINAVIANSGQILTTNTTSDGIQNEGDNVHIINSGIIRSAQASAINIIAGTTPTLSLLKGSNLQGPVDTAIPLTLNVQTGLNLALTLNSGSIASFGITAPFAVLGSAIGVIDPTGLAMQTDVVADLSDTFLNSIYRHKIALPCSCLPCGIDLWVQGLGSYRKRSRQNSCVGYDNWQGGFLAGGDVFLCGGNIGVFGGLSSGEATVDQRTQKADFSSYVGGITYERIFCNTFLGLACVAGRVDWNNKRFVMNNLTPGGIDTARANTGGTFVSPEATLAHRFFSFWFHPAMSFTVRYAGLFLGNYTESGSLTNLTVRDREVDLLTTRFEMTIPYARSCGACCTSFEPYVGVYRRYQLGNKMVGARLLGQSIRFDPGSPHNLVALLIGFRGLHSFGCFNLFANCEASFDDHSSSRVLGEGGLGLSF